jgi:LmbE family N-acetylglucosaminyl deacetylase
VTDNDPTALTPDDTSGVSRILVITAHPDDVDFGVAGSVAVWTKAGIEVSYCVSTNGEAGGSDRTMARDDMARLRQEEQRAAAQCVGVTDVTFLGHPDGRLLPSIELRRDISAVIRRVRPDRVVCQSAQRDMTRFQASHPDHLAAGEAALCAVYPDARNPFAHPELLAEGIEPHTVPETWIMSFSDANRVVDITDTFELKLSALGCHKSQIADINELAKWMRPRFEALGQAAGLAPGRLAECFTAVATA